MPKAKCIVRIIKFSRPSNIRFESTLRACKRHNWHKWTPLIAEKRISRVQKNKPLKFLSTKDQPSHDFTTRPGRTTRKTKEQPPGITLPDIEHSTLVHPPLPTNGNLHCWWPSIRVPSVTLLSTIHFSVSVYESSKISTVRWYPFTTCHHGLPKKAVQHTFPQTVQSALGGSSSVWNQVLKSGHFC